MENFKGTTLIDHLCVLHSCKVLPVTHVNMCCNDGHIMLMSPLCVEMGGGGMWHQNTKQAGSHQIIFVPILLNTASTVESLECNLL